MKRVSLLFLFIITTFTLCAQTLVVEISGIRNKDGVIRLAFFVSDENFKSERPMKEYVIDKSTVRNGSMIFKLDSISPGTYGLALLDDENKNGKLDYRLFLPKEGVGFTNYNHHGIKRPVFSDFSFLLKRNVTLRRSICLKYY